MTDEQFAEILAFGHERRGTEFKGPGPLTANQLRARMVKAALGMVNYRDGGLIIIGVDDVAGTLTPVGLTPDDLMTWRYEDIADAIGQYADPSIGFEREIRQFGGAQFVVLRVNEFEDIPVLCKREFPGVLTKGSCYVRSRRKPETTEIPTQEDMRDLLDLATEKRLRKLVAMIRAAGAEIVPGSPDANLFDAQIKGLL